MKGEDTMILQQFKNEPIAALSYLIGCTATGEAAIIDPNLAAEQYVLAAADYGLRITLVLETHMHADYYSTGRAIAYQTGAQLALPAGANALFEHTAINDGDRFQIGNVMLRALHTPGHTPEHMSYVVSDTTRSFQPWFVFTGDCLFVGDVGRTDLVDLPGSGSDILYDSIVNVLLRLPDYVEIYPGHYSGSPCGSKEMSPKLSSTIGFERRFNWALQAPDKATFVEWVNKSSRDSVESILQHRNTNRGELALQPQYDYRINLFKPDDQRIPELSTSAAAHALSQGAVCIDLRPQNSFARKHPAGAINIVYNRNSFLNNLKGLVNTNEPLIFYADHPVIAHAAASMAMRSNYSNILGYLAGDPAMWDDSELAQDELLVFSIDELYDLITKERVLVLDVRNPSEWAKGVIDGARLVRLFDLRSQLASLPRDQRIITICESGMRATTAASLLKRFGFPDVAAVSKSGMSAYASSYPTVAYAN